MKPIRITDAFKTQALEAFQKTLNAYTEVDGPLSFKMEPTAADSKDVVRPTIRMTASAYLKMMGLVLEYANEICWHGLIERLSDTEFRIYDIVVYPQIEAGMTVEMDEDKYALWNMQQSDEVINALHFQGHSHVNIAPTPSGTDTRNWDDFRRNLTDDGYYVFCIANKKSEINWWIYDHATNWIYEPKDISFFVELTDGSAIKTWTDSNIKEFVAKKSDLTKASTVHTTGGAITSYGAGYDNRNDKFDGARDYSYYDNYGYQQSMYGRNYSSVDNRIDLGMIWDEDDLLFSDTAKAGFEWSGVYRKFVKVLPLAQRNKNAAKRGRGRPAGSGGKAK